MWFGLLAIALVKNRSRRRRIVILLIVALTIFVPAAFEGVFWNGDGWQGRYQLPFAVGIPLIAGFMISREPETDHEFRKAVGMRWIPYVWGAVNLLSFAILYHRYAIGFFQSWNPVYFKWEPNIIGGVFWIIVEVLATAALVVWTLRAHDKRSVPLAGAETR
jgi:hypothetical protein